MIRLVAGKLTTDDLLDLTEERAQAILDAGDETARWALLELSALARRNAGLADDPATPSAMVPPYKKPAKKKSKKGKKPGRKVGHEGERRPPPEVIDERKEHFAEQRTHLELHGVAAREMIFEGGHRLDRETLLEIATGRKATDQIPMRPKQSRRMKRFLLWLF